MENKDLSNIVVGSDGILVDISEGSEIPCPTCKMKGRIPDPKYFGKPVAYYNPITGDSFPHISCRTCKGAGWVYDRKIYVNN